MIHQDHYYSVISLEGQLSSRQQGNRVKNLFHHPDDVQCSRGGGFDPLNCNYYNCTTNYSVLPASFLPPSQIKRISLIQEERERNFPDLHKGELIAFIMSYLPVGGKFTFIGSVSIVPSGFETFNERLYIIPGSE